MNSNLENIQGALCEDCAKGWRKPKLYQTLNMCHFFSFCFLSSLFQSAAVDQGKAPVQNEAPFI